MATGQGQQRLLVGRVLPGLGLLGFVGKLEFIKQNFTQLLGRIQIKLHARQLVDLGAITLDMLAEFDGKPRQRLGVDAHAFVLHVHQHWH